MTFKESESLSAGNTMTVLDTPFCRIGVAICYDIRFAELSLLMAQKHGPSLFPLIPPQKCASSNLLDPFLRMQNVGFPRSF
jgi:predicted amidohydrolase